MQLVLWGFQIILSIKLLTVAYTHGLRQDKAEMRQAIQKLGNFSRPVLYLVTVGALLACGGLLLPLARGFWPWLTPWTALGVAVALLVSIIFHVRGRAKPNIFVSLILGAMAAFVAYGRW
jgi:hypothetical protein